MTNLNFWWPAQIESLAIEEVLVERRAAARCIESFLFPFLSLSKKEKIERYFVALNDEVTDRGGPNFPGQCFKKYFG